MTVLVAGIDAESRQGNAIGGIHREDVEFTPFDAEEAAKIPHFDTYNRTAASQRVADIVEALRATSGCGICRVGDAALAGLLALGVETERRAILDVGDFDMSSDAAFLERLYHAGPAAGRRPVHSCGAGRRSRRHPQRRRQVHPRRTQVRREKLTAKEISVC